MKVKMYPIISVVYGILCLVSETDLISVFVVIIGSYRNRITPERKMKAIR